MERRDLGQAVSLQVLHPSQDYKKTVLPLILDVELAQPDVYTDEDENDREHHHEHPYPKNHRVSIGRQLDSQQITEQLTACLI